MNFPRPGPPRPTLVFGEPRAAGMADDAFGCHLCHRDHDLVQKQLDVLRADARNGVNTMPALVEASDAGATMGEMVQALADVFGRYSGGPEW